MTSPSLYDLCRFLHITGVVMLMGNITVTAIWKFFADRDGRAEVLGFAQKLVTYTDWAMTVWGVVLTMAVAMAWRCCRGADLTSGWLLWGQILFVVAGLIWLLRIVPLQIRQARAAQGVRRRWRGARKLSRRQPALDLLGADRHGAAGGGDLADGGKAILGRPIRAGHEKKPDARCNAASGGFVSISVQDRNSVHRR